MRGHSTITTGLLMTLWRGSRIQGLIIKVLVVTIVAAAFRTTRSVIGTLDARGFLRGSVGSYFIKKTILILTFAEPILWVWFLVVPFFAVVMMYRASEERPEGQKSAAGGAPLTRRNEIGCRIPLGFGLSKGAGVDLAFFSFVFPPQEPFNPPNDRSMRKFDPSMKNT
jgi:hypothetical protein